MSQEATAPEITLRLVEAKTVVQMTGRKVPLLPITLGIATAAVGVGTAVFGALALQASKDWQSLRATSSVTPSAASAAIAKTQNLALATDILGGLTIVGVGATTYFSVRGQRDESKDRATRARGYRTSPWALRPRDCTFTCLGCVQMS